MKSTSAGRVLVETVARCLGPLREEVAFLGGAVTTLYLSDPAAPEVRATIDVDVIVEVASRLEYYRLAKRLTELSFREVTDEGAPVCRWKVAGVLVDVMPTLLGLCDISIPSQVQGMDYSTTFVGKSKKQRDAAFLFNVHRGGGPETDWRGIRTKEWTYAYHFSGGWVMYDLKNDPYQLRNLVDNPKYTSKKNQLREQLETMRKALGESLTLKGKMPAPIRLPV